MEKTFCLEISSYLLSKICYFLFSTTRFQTIRHELNSDKNLISNITLLYHSYWTVLKLQKAFFLQMIGMESRQSNLRLRASLSWVRASDLYNDSLKEICVQSNLLFPNPLLWSFSVILWQTVEIQNKDNQVITGLFRSLSNQNDEGDKNVIMLHI